MSVENQNLDLAKCFVSVVVITYNHEKYIKQCLDSILMQKVDFPFEIIISDDCSTDQTPEIIREYQKKYSHIVKPILRSVNVGATRNQYDCFLRCTGDYVAILDGDDFWKNEQKLKIQTNFLENNKTYIACTQRYSVVDENNIIVQDSFYGPGRPESGDYTINDFQNYIYYGHPGTLVFKNIFLAPKYDFSIIYEADRWICDMTLCLILTCLGRIQVSDDNMASYRSFQKKGGTNYSSSIARENRCIERLNFLEKLEVYCRDELKVEVKHEDRMPYHVWWSVLYMLRFPSLHNWVTLKTICRMVRNKRQVFKYVLKQLPTLPIFVFMYLKKKAAVKVRRYFSVENIAS